MAGQTGAAQRPGSRRKIGKQPGAWRSACCGCWLAPSYTHEPPRVGRKGPAWVRGLPGGTAGPGPQPPAIAQRDRSLMTRAPSGVHPAELEVLPALAPIPGLLPPQILTPRPRIAYFGLTGGLRPRKREGAQAARGCDSFLSPQPSAREAGKQEPVSRRQPAAENLLRGARPQFTHRSPKNGLGRMPVLASLTTCKPLISICCWDQPLPSVLWPRD